jgi:hypothetical protein
MSELYEWAIWVSYATEWATHLNELRFSYLNFYLWVFSSVNFDICGFWYLWVLISVDFDICEFWYLWVLISVSFDICEFWYLWVLISVSFDICEFWYLWLFHLWALICGLWSVWAIYMSEWATQLSESCFLSVSFFIWGFFSFEGFWYLWILISVAFSFVSFDLWALIYEDYIYEWVSYAAEWTIYMSRWATQLCDRLFDWVECDRLSRLSWMETAFSNGLNENGFFGWIELFQMG